MVPPSAGVGKHPAQWHMPQQSHRVLCHRICERQSGMTAAEIKHSIVRQTRTRATVQRNPPDVVPLPPPVDANRNGWVTRFASDSHPCAKRYACRLNARRNQLVRQGCQAPHADKLTCALQLDAMNLGTLLPEMPQLLSDMGASYDPRRLAAVLGRRRLAINLRALRIAATLGGFITSLAKVRSSTGCRCCLSSGRSNAEPLYEVSATTDVSLTRPLNSTVHVGWQDYATGAFEANMDRRATELQGILARLGPSFAKVSTHSSLHWSAATSSRFD